VAVVEAPPHAVIMKTAHANIRRTPAQRRENRDFMEEPWRPIGEKAVEGRDTGDAFMSMG
jgi:hypothetical protein